MKASRRSALPGVAVLLSAVLMVLLTTCTDAPVAGPRAADGPVVLHLLPQLSYATASGTPAAGSPQEDALNQAFDRVNRFRLIITRVGSTEVLLDVIIDVVPGQDSYDLDVTVEGVEPGEAVSVTIIALEGETVLFESPPVTVTTTDTQTASPPQPVSLPLTYVGPGAEAGSVEILSDGVLLGPGDSETLTARVLDTSGAVIADVPLGWSVDVPSAATVDEDGTVTGGGGGRALVTVTTPTGLDASVWVYVIGGDITFVQGGMVMTSAAVGGVPEVIAGTGGAHGPVPLGGGVMYGEGGMVLISGVEIMEGSWPAPSPDGTKIAADGGGVILLANADGSGLTEGPAGTPPVWAGEGSLYVAGGSIESVNADGTNRVTVVAGPATFPTLTAEGRLAYVDGSGQVFIKGSGPIPGVVTGSRPAIAGGWVLFSGADGLTVAPTDGRSPPMALGIDGDDPAWGGADGGFTPPTPPPSVEITGLVPEAPVPGQEATILGSGFDFVIASNTRVFFPTAGGEVEVEVLEVTAESVRVMVPRGVAAGDIRVATRTSEATFPYTPQFGSLELTAVTPWGTPVAGVTVTLSQDGTAVATGVTGDDGSVFLDAIPLGDYTVAYGAPDGFSVTGDPPTALTIGTDVVSVEVETTPEVRSVVVSPEAPVVEVGSSVEVTLRPLDINGDVIPQVDNVAWVTSSVQVDASGDGLNGVLTGLSPSATAGEALYRVLVNGTGRDFFATVTSFIEGTIALGGAGGVSGTGGEEPAAVAAGVPDVEVELIQSSTVIGRATTDADGHFKLGDLFAGDYTVKPVPRGDFKGFSPTSVDVTLGPGNTTGIAEFEAFKKKVVVVSGLWGSSAKKGPNEGSLFTVDAATGTATLVGAIGLTNPDGVGEMSGLDFDPTTGVLYGMFGSACTGATLVTVDPSSGLATTVGVLVGAGFDGTPGPRSGCLGGSDAIAFAPDGTLYAGGWNGGSGAGKLLKVDKTTGVVLEQHLTTSSIHLAGLAFASDGTLWASRGGNNPGVIHTIDVSTGATLSTLPLVDSSGSSEPIRVSDLAFASDGTLYGSIPTENQLITIDPATGLVTRIGSFGSSVARLSGLTTVR